MGAKREYIRDATVKLHMDCECGLLYSRSPTDRATHRRWHDVFVNGIVAKPLRDDEVLSESTGFRVVLVRPQSSLLQRKRLEKLGRRANREMHYDFGVYCAIEDSNHDLEVHGLMGCADERGIALLLLARREYVWLAEWSESNPPKIVNPQAVPNTGRWTVDFAWVLPKFRGRGIAKKLIQESARFVGLPVEELAWYTPFSDSGRRLVHGLSPERFWIGK